MEKNEALKSNNAAGDAKALNAALEAWVLEGKGEVSASERLRRIKAQLPVAEVSRAPARVSWRPAFAAAACVAMMVGAAVWGIYVDPPVEVAFKPAPGPREGGAPEAAPVIARVVGHPVGLFRGREGSMEWAALRSEAPCSRGDLVQAALEEGEGDLRVDGHRIRLFAGALVCLSEMDRVDIWRGKVTVTAGSTPLQIGSAGPGKIVALTVKPGAQRTLQAEAGEDETLSTYGFKLLNAAKLKPTPVIEVQAPASTDDNIDEGSARLLNVIACNYRDKALTEIVQGLRESLGLRIRLSAAAETMHGQRKFSLELGEVTGAEALAQLADRAGLKVGVRDGEIVLELADEKQALGVPLNDDTF